ncbi:neuropeptide CCHamide-1 [Drosophila ficusphila]|uniref:neuropeptide CCHamide-1 n=1 Tax=Drosophila ficusphila TaxID=30025 RepID=UPI0007E612C7|nr:neuropeptide CCHamide-1 [Drosophila ficusphila]
MWYSKCSWTLVVLVALFALVTGSCLEYGHSCWGAHGKRSGGKAVIDAKQPSGPNSYAIDTLAEELYNNQNNQNNPEDNDDDSNTNTNTNSGSNIPLAVPVLSTRRDLEDRNRSGPKWTQLMRQHRYQLRQLQDQQQREGRGRGGQYDAAAESWRKLQQALQAQIDAENEMPQMPPYDLTK